MCDCVHVRNIYYNNTVVITDDDNTRLCMYKRNSIFRPKPFNIRIQYSNIMYIVNEWNDDTCIAKSKKNKCKYNNTWVCHTLYLREGLSNWAYPESHDCDSDMSEQWTHLRWICSRFYTHQWYMYDGRVFLFTCDVDMSLEPQHSFRDQRDINVKR